MHIGSARWIQLVIGIIGMVAIANLQYGWTLFVNPIDSKFHWGKATIQVAFTLFVLAETWLVPVEGYLVDRFGPRLLVAIGGILVGVAWWINAEASTLFTLYLGGLVGGVLGVALKFLGPMIAELGGALAQAMNNAFVAAVEVVLYFDIRCRKEAFDLEHLARVVASAPQMEPQPA